MKHYLKHAQTMILFSLLLALLFASSCQAAPLTIATNGKSTFAIVIPKVAPVSVTNAAAEMQHDIQEATGAKLPIQKDSDTNSQSFISLGSTQQAKQASVSTKGLADGGFRVHTANGNLYIIGIDTTTVPSQWKNQTPRKITPHPEIPGPAYTSKGGFSNGTANGVYSFLENQLGVRWLFPGDLGRVVPAKRTFTLGAIDRTYAPPFNFRILSVIRGGDTWRARQKLGYSANIHYTHAFAKIAPASLWKKHPEWFAMINGKRRKPVGHNYKLETTNQQLVKYMADEAVKALKANPELYSFSISPSDGAGWSESAASKALYDPPQTPGGKISVTPAILKFYRDVCAIVAKKDPKGKIGGYLYQFFSHPPQKGSMQLPPNFIPTIVGKSMGYTFYRKDTRTLEAKLLNEWAKVAPKDWYYYGMPTWLRESSAQVTPAAPKELNFLYHTMLGAHIKGAEIYGTYMWSQGALVNYINAKMLWNPKSDATVLQRDWLNNAYGPKAGAIMETLYNKLDQSWWSDFFRSPQSTHYNNSEVMFHNTFGAHYPQMEKLFLQAWAQPMTKRQRQRLDLIRQNMIALQFRLRNAGYISADYNSPLTKTAKQVFTLFTDPKTKDNFSYIIVSRTGGAVTPITVSLKKAPQTKSEAFPNDNKIVLYSTKDQTVTMTPAEVLPGSSFLSYYLQDAKGKLITRGFLSNGDAITFEAKAGAVYYLSTILKGIRIHPPIKWKLHIPQAANAKAIYNKDTLYLSPENKGSIYVFLPDELHLHAEKSDNGLTIQTETAGVAKSRHARQMRRTAKKVLSAALKDHQARQVVDLDYNWRFKTDASNKGKSEGYETSSFDDSSWKKVNALEYWQNQGFAKYHGIAWYRKTFTLSSEQTDPLAMGNKKLLLFFGNIDGDAKVYFNGSLIDNRIMAQHSMGWDEPLVYDINNLVHIGKNTVAVKVTKQKFAAGLYRGVDVLEGVMGK